jgi:hypothetical protein
VDPTQNMPAFRNTTNEVVTKDKQAAQQYSFLIKL